MVLRPAKPSMIIHLKSSLSTTIDLYEEHPGLRRLAEAHCMDCELAACLRKGFIDASTAAAMARSAMDSVYTMCAVTFAHEEWGSGWNGKTRRAKATAENKDIEKQRKNFCSTDLYAPKLPPMYNPFNLLGFTSPPPATKQEEEDEDEDEDEDEEGPFII
eukprot:jgi/Psemu1/30641/gm1.30641_g